MSKETLKNSLRTVRDFPIPGILFWDVTTLFKDAACLRELEDILYEMYKDKGITKIVGIESRGFVMARKPGKLPAEVLEEHYDKEYGKDTIQIHKDAITEDDVVLLHDDLLATGGTMCATHRLVERFHPKQIYVNFVIELTSLHGRDNFPEGVNLETVLQV